MKTFIGKTAVVTGGGSGIGRALVERLAAEQMKVAVLDVRPEAAETTAEAMRASGLDATAFVVDVTDRAGLTATARAVEARYGGVDLLCNNAGVTTFSAFQALKDGDWDWEFAVNLRGAIDVVRAFLPAMLQRPGERHIVTTASIAGLVAGFTPDIVPYTVAKFGVVGFSEVLRQELAGSGIGVSVLCPGGVRTNIMLSGARRPEALGGAAPVDQERHRRVQESGLDPGVVADMVLAAIQREQFYIFTSAATRQLVEQRFAAISSGFDALDQYLASGRVVGDPG
jgi:NAD(P)-dependent dehydrogenase (short-subunit alcohol dehydrogenase family)